MEYGMDIEQLRKDASAKWASLPWEVQDAVSRLVHGAGRSSEDNVVFNFTGAHSDHASVANLRQLARTVGHPHVRIVNGEDYFSLSESIVSVIVKNHANQLALF